MLLDICFSIILILKDQAKINNSLNLKKYNNSNSNSNNSSNSKTNNNNNNNLLARTINPTKTE